MGNSVEEISIILSWDIMRILVLGMADVYKECGFPGEEFVLYLEHGFIRNGKRSLTGVLRALQAYYYNIITCK